MYWFLHTRLHYTHDNSVYSFMEAVDIKTLTEHSSKKKKKTE